MRSTSSFLHLLSVLAALGFAAPVAAADSAPRTDLLQTPSGTYVLDPSHASVSWKISHLGFSHFVGRFDTIAATLKLDSAKPENSTLSAEVNPASVNTHVSALDAKLIKDPFFNTKKFPKITFTSKRITLTGGNKAIIDGELTLLGVTRPLSLDTTLVGAGVNSYTSTPTFGISAVGSIKRSDYGMNAYVPDVGDDVQIAIDAEFNQDKTAAPEKGK